jgi:hypothetical protein
LKLEAAIGVVLRQPLAPLDFQFSLGAEEKLPSILCAYRRRWLAWRVQVDAVRRRLGTQQEQNFLRVFAMLFVACNGLLARDSWSKTLLRTKRSCSHTRRLQ